ncbi:hypothetical protein [Bradyrhizobium diazoefficiens]|uniref:hypothetical protein n=1 Tax=Bradyrhizobium diazoefficiens TaxID=1355477 RepID=UPI0035113185
MGGSDPSNYASVCTITGPAAARASPASSGPRSFSIQAIARPVRLLRLLELVEDRDRCDRVVAGIDDVIGAETVDVADDRNGAVLDAARQLLRAPAFRLGLTDGGIHGFLLPAIDVGFVPGLDVTPKRGARIPSLVNPALIRLRDLQPMVKHASTSLP